MEIVDKGKYLCKHCGIEKPTAEFSWPERKNKRKMPDTDRCKQCKREARKLVTDALGKDKIREINQESWRNKSREKRLTDWARLRAKQKGLPFNITWKDVIIPDICPVFGIPFEYNNHERTASLDRIIPDLGYVVGNIAVISLKANVMKNAGTVEEVGKLYHWMLSLELDYGLCRPNEECKSTAECDTLLSEM